MSGGSYNYLFEAADSGSLHLPTLARMALRIATLAPGSAAAHDTALMVSWLQDPALKEVWRSVEWLDSGDLGRDVALADIAEYATVRHAGEQASHGRVPFRRGEKVTVEVYAGAPAPDLFEVYEGAVLGWGSNPAPYLEVLVDGAAGATMVFLGPGVVVYRLPDQDQVTPST